MKKSVIFIFICTLILTVPFVCSASEELPCIFVNGNLLEQNGDFVIQSDTVYAGANRLAEVFGYTLSSDDEGYVHSFSDSVRTVTYDSHSGSVNIGDRHSFAYEISDDAYTPYKSTNDNPQKFVPLRMFCDSFGIGISYEEIKNEIYITRTDIRKGLYNSEGVAIAKRRDKYGLVSLSGTLIASYKYDYINNYDNPLIFKVTDNHRCGLIDSKGNSIVEVKYNEINYTSDSEIYLVEGSCKGMCNINGDIIIPVQYTDIIYCGNNTAMVNNGGKWQILRCSTNTLEGETYDNVYKVTAGIQTDNSQIKGYYVEKKGKWGYVDSFGTLIIDLKYDAIDKFDIYGRARVISGDKFGIVDCGGKVIIPTAYDYIYPFGNLNIAVAQVGSKYGAIDTNSTPVIPFEYDYIYSFEDALSTVCYKDGKFAIISNQGVLLTDFIYSYAEPFKAGMALAYNSGYGYIDHSGHEVIECIHSEVKQGSALSMFLRYDDSWALFSADGTNLTGFIYDSAGEFSNGLSAVSILVNGKPKYGYVNDSGDIIIAHIYDSAQSFNYGKAIVSANGNYGIIDVEGNTVIPFEYKGFNPSYDYNLIAAAGQNGRWGVISFTGEVVADFVYDYVFEYENGYAVVLESNRYGVIDANGKSVVSPVFASYEEALQGIPQMNY